VALAGSAPTQPLGHGLASRAGRQALRPAVFVSRGQLDQELASGADPASSPALAVRADQLLRRRYRRRLARSVERLVAEFDANRGWWFSAAVPFLREQVAEARGTLVSVAGALRDTQPVRARGVAMVSRLITNPESPLYVRNARGALQLRAHNALDHLLDGCQPWCELPAAPPPPTQGGPDGHR
jgi:hypothetical protein